jgi:hypothetical protein
LPIKFYLDEKLLPGDGSLEVLRRLESSWPHETKISVFPDVHLKKNAPVTNGLLTLSKDTILTEMLGVANCGFTLAELNGLKTEISFENVTTYLRENLGIYDSKTLINCDDIKTKLIRIYKNLITEPEYENTFNFLKLTNKKASNFIESSINKVGWKAIKKSYNCLGSGNHFLELHRSKSNPDKLYILLHTDSIGVGMKTLQMYEPLSNVNHSNIMFKCVRKLRILSRKIKFHRGYGLSELLKSLYIIDIQKTKQLSVHSSIGRRLIADFLFAEIVGFLNRSQIIECLSKGIGVESHYQEISSISHDSVQISNIDGKKVEVLQRNGVQNLARKIGIIPSHAGGEALLVAGKDCSPASGNINHGTGKLAQDSKIAKVNSQNTPDLEVEIISLDPDRGIDISKEQFKDLSIIQNQITDYGLADVLDTLSPMIIVKG